MNEETKDSKKLEIERELDEIKTKLTRLENFSNTLDMRLTSVLNKNMKIEGEDCLKDVERNTPLGSELSDINKRIEIISNQIELMLDTLEL